MSTEMKEEKRTSITDTNNSGITATELNVTQENENNTPSFNKRYFDLLPDEDREDHTSFTALEEALDNPRIHNIAITGSYGAGKSSIIKSFIKSKHIENKCIEISLASFTCKKNDNQWDDFFNSDKNELVYNDESCGEEKSEIKISDIETSILQQIVYKKSADELPNSKFSRIKHLPYTIVNDWANKIIWFIISIITFIRGECIISYIFPTIDFANMPGLIVSCGIKYGSFIVILCLFIHLFKKMFLQFSRIKSIKLSLKSAAEIELNSEFHNSVLNRRLNEILYFFESCPQYEIVIFEDLDRFENPEIYTRLRELNILLNGYEKLITNERKRICFIYALRDNVFEGTERVKFFDFIIPVVPVINSSNSANFLIKFKEKHLGSGYFNGIENDYIKDICRFIDDMRLLKNIINEYMFYVDKIHNQKNVNLFSLIVYKNLFPSDFAKLQYGEGKLADFIKSKGKIVDEICKENENEVKVLKQKISDIQKEQFDKVIDLRRLYLFTFFQKKEHLVNKTEFDLLCQDDNFSEILTTKNIHYSYIYNFYSYKTNEHFDVSEIQKDLGQNKSYKESESNILSKKDIVKLTARINELKKDIIQIKKCSLSDLSKNYVEIVQKYILFGKCKDLISYLISNSYIDENYLEYISLFYEGLLTNDDNNFISSVRTNCPLPYTHKLTNIKNIIDAIHPFEWKKSKSLINYDLVNYLVRHQDSYKNYLSDLMQLIATDAELNFLKNKINEKDENFIKIIFAEVSNLWKKMEYTYEEEELLIVAPIILSVLDEIEINDDFVDFINQHSSIVNNFDYLSPGEIVSKLYDIGVCFKDLIDIEDDSLMLEIANKKLFEINFKNLQTICHVLDKRTGNSIITNCLSIIFESGTPTLVQFIKDNIVQVLNILFDNLDSLDELLDPVLFICNNQNIEIDLKKRFLLKNQTPISDITLIENQELWLSLLTNKTVSPNWKNVFSLFSYLDNQLTDDFINFLNEKNIARKLSTQKIESIIDSDKYEVSNFFKQIAQKSAITFETLKLLNPLSKWKSSDYDYDSLGKEKVEFLVKSDSITYCKDELDKIRNYDASMISTYINFNLEKYIEDSEAFTFSDIEKITLDNNISNENKKLLFEKSRTILFENSEKLTNNFVSTIYNLNIELTNNEITKILENQQITYENKVKTFIGPMPIGNGPLNHGFILNSLYLIDECFSDIKNRNYILMPDTKVNNELFEYLNLQGLFSSKKIMNGQIKMNIAKSFFKDGR